MTFIKTTDQTPQNNLVADLPNSIDTPQVITQECCEYDNCENDGVTFDVELEAWLCKDHEYCTENKTGYCDRDCRLGHGCTETC